MQSRMTWVTVPFCTIVGTFTSFKTTEVVPEIHTSHKLSTFLSPLLFCTLWFRKPDKKPTDPDMLIFWTWQIFFFTFLVIFLWKIIPGNVTLHSIKYVSENVRYTGKGGWKPQPRKPGGGSLAKHAKCEKSCDIGQNHQKIAKISFFMSENTFEILGILNVLLYSLRMNIPFILLLDV